MSAETLKVYEPKIYAAICSIIGDIGAVAKGKKNVQQGFMYRGIDDVMNALQPMLAKYHVFVVPSVLEQNRSDRETKNGGISHLSIFKVKYTFYADDGSSVEAVTVGESDDTGDKGSNKAMAIAFKYALFQVFCIPTEEMPDPDAGTPEETKPKVTPKPQTAPIVPPQQPTAPTDDKQRIINHIGHLLYPDAVGKDKGNADGFRYEIYSTAMVAYNKLDAKVKKLTDLNIDQLKDMAQKMEAPPVLR